MGILKFGTNSPLALYMGVSGSTKAYYGTTEVFSGGGTDYSTLYTTMEILTGGTITLNSNLRTNTISYSLDDGSSWVSAVSGNSITVSAGDKVLWKGTNTSYATQSIFTTSAYFNVFGNAMSLLYGDDFTGQTVVYKYGLRSLFRNLNVVEAGNFVLPATILGNDCYYNMFLGCRYLSTAPSLPATTLAASCYRGMFASCVSLTTAPALPATTLADKCYYNMFSSCSNLTVAPDLPAPTLVSECYRGMFINATNLSSIKCLATDITALNSITNWLSNVAASGTYYKPAAVTYPTGASGIPEGWTVIND